MTPLISANIDRFFLLTTTMEKLTVRCYFVSDKNSPGGKSVIPSVLSYVFVILTRISVNKWIILHQSDISIF